MPHSLIFLLADDCGSKGLDVSRGLLVIKIVMMKLSSYSKCQPVLQWCPPQQEEAPQLSLPPLWTLKT